MTIDELIERCTREGVRPSDVARKFGYTRHWLYVERKKPLPYIVNLALEPAIKEIKEEV